MYEGEIVSLTGPFEDTSSSLLDKFFAFFVGEAAFLLVLQDKLFGAV